MIDIYISCMYDINMEIQYDPNKAESNLKKHKIGFKEAATCLLDPLAIGKEDPDAELEQRFIVTGMSEEDRILTVCYTLRLNTIRIISARKATKAERGNYEKRI